MIAESEEFKLIDLGDAKEQTRLGYLIPPTGPCQDKAQPPGRGCYCGRWQTQPYGKT